MPDPDHRGEAKRNPAGPPVSVPHVVCRWRWPDGGVLVAHGLAKVLDRRRLSFIYPAHYPAREFTPPRSCFLQRQPSAVR